MAAPTILSVYPANETESFLTVDKPYIIVEGEVDSTTIQFMVEGPDTDRWSGPDLVRWDDPTKTSDDTFLDSPGYKGLVAGVLSIEKIDTNGNTVSALDYTGGGSMWNTKITFSPDAAFAASTEYRVYIIGDEDTTDDVVSGISARTVFDTVRGANMGDGTATFSGGYTGTADDTFYVKVVEAGDAVERLDVQWWRGSAPMVIHQLETRESSQLLANGVSVIFSGDFVVDDEFHVVVQPAERLETTYTWSFTTGSGNITEVPEDLGVVTSVPVGGFTSGSTVVSTSSDPLRVVSITPNLRATNLDPTTITEIVVTFNHDLDPETITEETVRIWSEPVNGDPSILADGTLSKTLTVVDNVLTITIG